MAKIKYVFADGHSEEVEVTEEFKREYEFLLVREQALHWKEMKQKERASGKIRRGRLRSACGGS